MPTITNYSAKAMFPIAMAAIPKPMVLIGAAALLVELDTIFAAGAPVTT